MRSTRKTPEELAASTTELHQALTASTNDLLLSDAKLAMTFLDLAEQPSATPENRERRFQEAAHAYDFILKTIARTALTQKQKEALMADLTILRERLDRHSTTFRS